ncbi:MAG: hypothetical protein DWH75_00265, partial [Planctomycetota bacterium]
MQHHMLARLQSRGNGLGRNVIHEKQGLDLITCRLGRWLIPEWEWRAGDQATSLGGRVVGPSQMNLIAKTQGFELKQAGRAESHDTHLPDFRDVMRRNRIGFIRHVFVG